MSRNKQFCIWVDGDSCAIDARNLVSRRGLREGFEVRVVANRPIPLPSGARHAMIVVSEGDTADEYIVRALGSNDIVVTRDTVLAERIAKNGNTVLNDRGDQFDADAARERRSIRDFSMALKSAGLRRTPDGSRGPREVKRFADALDRAITRAKRAQKPGKEKLDQTEIHD